MEINCEIIRDLLPSYADGVACDETRRAVEKHVETCAECRGALESMRAGEQEKPEIAREIDYLKKNRKRNRMIVFFSMIAAILTVAGLIFAKLFLIGEISNGENIAMRVEVEGRLVKVRASVMDSINTIKGFEFEEKDGVVTVKTRTVLAGFVGSVPNTGEYEAKEEIEKVVSSNQIMYTKKTLEDGWSAALRNDLQLDWRKWESMTETERMISSSMPGHISKQFKTWADAVDYLGFEPFNPLESCRWLQKMNFAGTDVIADPDSYDLMHAYLYLAGSEDGEVNYASLEAGYSMNAVSVTGMEKGSENSVALIEATLSEVYSADGGEKETFYVISNQINLTETLIPNTWQDEDGNVFIELDGIGSASDTSYTVTVRETLRVVYTVEPVVRASGGAGDHAERHELENGQVIFVNSSRSGANYISDIMFDVDGMHFTVRVIGENRETVKAGTERLFELVSGCL